MFNHLYVYTLNVRQLAGINVHSGLLNAELILEPAKRKIVIFVTMLS